MNQDTVNRAIEQAEAMAGAVKEPNMKAVVFGVLFSRLLDGKVSGPRSERTEAVRRSPRRSGGGTAPARILGLRGEGFFEEQRILSEVRDKLGVSGWHYPLTTLSGVMQALVQSHELRRVRSKVGKRQVWKYSNY